MNVNYFDLDIGGNFKEFDPCVVYKSLRFWIGNLQWVLLYFHQFINYPELKTEFEIIQQNDDLKS